MKYLLSAIIYIAITNFVYTQEYNTENSANTNQEKYIFTNLIDLKTSSVKNQGNTGTCWSFSTSSFLESEIFRITGKMIDISEMYNVRHTYSKKAWNYVMRQGKIQFSEGGLAHDVLNSTKQYGIVPEIAYSGLLENATEHNHSKIVPELKKVLDIFIVDQKNSAYPNWKYSVDTILDKYLGVNPENFTYNGKIYNSKSFLKMSKLDPSDYITLTSFNHHPYNTSFILNIPDNFSNGIFYNIKLDQLVDEVDNALKKGYTLALDCDVTDEGFSQYYGIAIVPKNPENITEGMTYIVEQAAISTEFRQEEFENYNTTDDHLMHIVGMAKDQKGNIYYKVKNSWGISRGMDHNKGYIFMSKSYLKLKTISVLVHKDALSKKVKTNLKHKG